MTWHSIWSYYSAKAQYNMVIIFVFCCYTVAERRTGRGSQTFGYRDVLASFMSPNTFLTSLHDKPDLLCPKIGYPVAWPQSHCRHKDKQLCKLLAYIMQRHAAWIYGDDVSYRLELWLLIIGIHRQEMKSTNVLYNSQMVNSLCKYAM